MTEISHEHFFDPRTLDRLVDGELAETERRQVLQTLDRQPDGWRQCALAFLEAQSWGQSLTQLARRPQETDATDAHEPADTATIAAPRSELMDGNENVPAADGADQNAAAQNAARNTRWRSLLAVAGGFLVTFSLGMYAQRFWHPSPNAGEATAMSTQGTGAAAGATAAGSNAMQLVDLVVTLPDGHQQRVRVPVVENQFAPFFVQPQLQAISPEMRATLLRMGGQLQLTREFVAVPFGDRQAIVPFDRVEIVPVRNAAVQ